MAPQQEILDTLAQWRNKKVRESDITLSQAADSLKNGSPLVFARPGYASTRWIFYKQNTEKVAVFTYVGVWAWASDLATGNFVPSGCTAPEHLPENRIQNTPSYRCELAYAFDTTTDATLWDDLKVLENHTTSQSGFNPRGKGRRNWQNGLHPQNREKYIVTAKIFTRKPPNFHAKQLRYPVHPWVSKALGPDSSQVPSPERPLYYDTMAGTNKVLEETNNPVFHKNDIVIMTFKLGIIVGTENWWPEIMPIEFVRVGRLPEHLNSVTDTALFPALGDEFVPLEVGKAANLFDSTSVSATKTEASDKTPHVKASDKTPHVKAEDKKPRVRPGDNDSGDDSSLGKRKNDERGQQDPALDGILAPSKKQALDTDSIMRDVSADDRYHENTLAANSWSLRSKDKNKENRALRS